MVFIGLDNGSRTIGQRCCSIQCCFDCFCHSNDWWRLNAYMFTWLNCTLHCRQFIFLVPCPVVHCHFQHRPSKYIYNNNINFLSLIYFFSLFPQFIIGPNNILVNPRIHRNLHHRPYHQDEPVRCTYKPIRFCGIT